MRRNKFFTVRPEWASQRGPGYPVILASRARLARNIEGIPFPPAADEDELERVRGMVLESVARRVADDEEWDIKFAEELSRDQLLLLAEQHLISRSFVEKTQGRAVAARWISGRGVIVNAQNHAKIFAIFAGAQLMKAWEVADKIDSNIERDVVYSYDQRLGYLTSSPTDVGTGLRVSIMLHLPALVITGEIGKTMLALGQSEILVRGMHGRGAGVSGNLFVISNKRTLGLSERDIIAQVETVSRKVAENERTARKILLQEYKLDISDRVFRTLGVLERARKLEFLEAVELLSLVKLGVDMEILPISDFNLVDVVMRIGNGHIKALKGFELDEEEVEKERAVHVRRILDL